MPFEIIQSEMQKRKKRMIKNEKKAYRTHGTLKQKKLYALWEFQKTREKKEQEVCLKQ